MPKAHTIPADSAEEVRAFVLPTRLTQPKRLRAVSLLPGTSSVVRNAKIAIEGGPTLALWDSAHRVTVLPAGAAFELPAEAKIVLTIHYKKNFREQDQPIADRSQVGLYFERRAAQR